MSGDILERKHYHAGAILISNINKDNHNAYWIKEGEVMAYVQTDKGKILEVSRHGPGEIIGENNLAKNSDQITCYRTITDCTLVTITRHSFEQNLKKIDKTTQSLFYSLIDKITKLEQAQQAQAIKNSEIENEAYNIVTHLLRNMPHDRQKRYEEVLLPQFNVMVKAIDEVKKKERHEKQKEHLEERLSQIHAEEAQDGDFIDLERKAYEENQTVQ